MAKSKKFKRDSCSGCNCNRTCHGCGVMPGITKPTKPKSKRVDNDLVKAVKEAIDDMHGKTKLPTIEEFLKKLPKDKP